MTVNVGEHDLAATAGEYEQVAVFLITLLRLIHNGPKLPGEMTIDAATGLDALALGARMAEVSDMGPVTASRLEAVATALGVTPVEHDASDAVHAEVVEGERTTVCTQLMRGGRWYCFTVPSVKGPPPSGPDNPSARL